MTTDGSLGPLADYLPHRPPMLLIDDIVEVTDDRALCRTTIRNDCVFAIDGRVHPSAMIEFFAQTCAIYVGVTSARRGGPPKLGFIMGSRECDFLVDSFLVGDELTIAATKIFGQMQLGTFSGTVMRSGELCARISLSVIDAELAAGQRQMGEVDG